MQIQQKIEINSLRYDDVWIKSLQNGSRGKLRGMQKRWKDDRRRRQADDGRNWKTRGLHSLLDEQRKIWVMSELAAV